MLKDLNGQVVPHSTEYIVVVGDEVTPITKRIVYNRVASFVHKSHALAFAKSITSFHTAVIDPDPAYDRRGDSEGRVYLNEPAYKLELLRRAEWKRFQQAVARARTAPDDVTLPEILQLQVILKMRKEVPAPRPSRAERAYGEQQFFHD